MAVINKTLEGFSVKELLQGTGSYAFDYVVTCKRKRSTSQEGGQPRAAEVEDIKGLLPSGPIKNVQDLAKSVSRE
ncbi:MAG: hypothetical protein OEQ53_05235 [Saprospiraceae bacterium]|nr:hypothetical protein [Saprospiraceae bacterium]